LASILYAEDDVALRRVSTLTLTGSGYLVTPVEDGLHAWEALHAGHYDLLITDNDMPRLTGLELATKARLEGVAVPIIMASGSLQCLAGTDREWLHLAATLSKPFTTEKLLATIKQVLRAASSVRPDGELLPLLAEAEWDIKPARYWGLNE
jgi:CheY-like chemotaxis protein